MNRLYLILPLTLILLFLGYYKLVVEKNYRAEQAQLEAGHAAVLAEEAREQELRQAAALAEARRLAEEEARAEAERRARKIAEQAEEEKKLRSALAEAKAAAEDAAQRRTELEARLEQVHAERTASQDALFALEREIELQQIARRNADREVQRLLSIVGLEIAESSVMSLPELPPTQPTAR